MVADVDQLVQDMLQKEEEDEARRQAALLEAARLEAQQTAPTEVVEFNGPDSSPAAGSPRASNDGAGLEAKASRLLGDMLQVRCFK